MPAIWEFIYHFALKQNEYLLSTLIKMSHHVQQERGTKSFPPGSLADMERIIATALQEQQVSTCQPFVIIDLRQGRAVGSTRYHNWSLQDYFLRAILPMNQCLALADLFVWR